MSRALLASSVSLTTTSTASTYSANTGGLPKHTLNMQWTPGTAANVLTVIVQVQCVNDGEWTQLMSWDDTATAGTYVRTVKQLQHTATGTSVVPLVYFFEGHAHAVRIKYAESEAGSSTKGTISAWLTSSI